jgi:hypothetical protein
MKALVNWRLIALCGFLALAGCHRNAEGEGPMQRTGNALDRAGTRTGRALGRAADVTGNAVSRAGQNTGAALNRTGDWIRDRTQ